MRSHVPRLERRRKRRHRLEVRVLEKRSLAALDLEQVLEVAGIEQHLFLGGAGLAGPPGGNALLSPGKPFDDREQVEWAERLAHERLGAAALRASRFFVVSTGE